MPADKRYREYKFKIWVYVHKLCHCPCRTQSGNKSTGHGTNSASRLASTCLEWMASMLRTTRSRLRSSATSPTTAAGILPSPNRSKREYSSQPPGAPKQKRTPLCHMPIQGWSRFFLHRICCLLSSPCHGSRDRPCERCQRRLVRRNSWSSMLSRSLPSITARTRVAEWVSNPHLVLPKNARMQEWLTYHTDG